MSAHFLTFRHFVPTLYHFVPTLYQLRWPSGNLLYCQGQSYPGYGTHRVFHNTSSTMIHMLFYKQLPVEFFSVLLFASLLLLSWKATASNSKQQRTGARSNKQQPAATSSSKKARAQNASTIVPKSVKNEAKIYEKWSQNP